MENCLKIVFQLWPWLMPSGKSCIILCVSKLHFYPTFCGTFTKLVQTKDPTKESADKNKAADFSAENSSYNESAVMYVFFRGEALVIQLLCQ